jgi:hypothetical protein
MPRSWPLLVPALLVAEHLGHVLTHWLEQPDPGVRAVLLEETGHGYMESFARVAGLALALVGAVFLSRVTAAFRNGPMAALPSWWWASVPALAFVVQEALGAGSAVLERPVLPLGAMVELACGLACVAVVRRLLLAAHGLGRALATRTAPRPRLAADAVQALDTQVTVLRVPALAWRRGERAPPAFG